MKKITFFILLLLGLGQVKAQPPTITGPVPNMGNITISCGDNPVTFMVTATDNNTTYPIESFGFTQIGAIDGKTYFLSGAGNFGGYFTGPNAFLNASSPNANNTVGKVASVENAAMNAFFNNAIDESVFIGYTDEATEGNFVWHNGSTTSYTNWDPATSAPNSDLGDEDYVRINNVDGTWEDQLGSIALRYVYELPGSFKQTAGLPSGSVFPPGTTTNTWVAYDIDGNMTTYSFDVTVAPDTEDPMINCPADITLVCGDSAFEYVVTATDNCTTFPIPAPAGFTALGSINGKSYFQSNTTFTAADAFIDAATRGGAVATIVDAAANTFIRDAKSGVALIGYNDVATEGAFVWQSGNPATYNNWAASEPNAGADKDYTQMDVLGEWNTLEGTAYTSYILEITGGIEQIAGLPSGSGFPPGVATTNTFVVTDLSGNTATCSFDVTGPMDMVAPTIDICPTNITIDNDPSTCGAVVDYVATASDDCTDFNGSLQNVLDNFNNNHPVITAEIPNMFAFFEGETGQFISNASGANMGMYAQGNILFPNGNFGPTYTNGSIISNTNFGANGKYFTRKRPGMFLMAADLDGMATFNTNGLTGTSGPTDGTADGFTSTITVNGTNYNIFVKRIYGAGSKPTINHIFIIPENASVSQTFNPDTTSDLHTLSGLSSTTRMYYLLYSSIAGIFIDNPTTETIAKTFIEQAIVPSQVAPVAVTGLPSGSVFPVGTTTVTLEITDAAGNVNSPACTFDVTVNDIEDPVIVCDVETTTTLSPVTASNLVAVNIPSIGPLSPSPFVTISESAIIGPGSTLDSVEIRIDHGNVEDLDIFLISPQGTSLELSTDNGGTGNNYTDTIFTDSAPNITTGSAPFTGMFRPEGGTFASTFAGEQINGQWTLAITDDATSNAGTLRKFIINFTAEVFDPADNTDEVFLDDTGNITLDPADYDDRVSDNCGIDTIVLSPNTFDCSDIGTPQTVTMTVFDNSGNSSNCDYIITVSDNLPPVITGCPADQNVTTDGTGMFALPDYTLFAGFSATDNCASPVILTQTPAAGTIVAVGTHTVTITASDGTNTADCVFDVIVVTGTNQAPIITCPITPPTETVDLNCDFILLDYTSLATATDDAGPPTVTQLPLPGTIVNAGTTVITLTADDGTLTADCTFNLVVNDVTPPTITCPADLIEDADTTGMFTLPDYTALATAMDNCSVTSIIQTPAAGTIIGLGVQVITLTASDGTNTTDCTFNLTVSDNTPPAITCPTDQTGDVDTACMFALPDYTSSATATDNAGTPTVTQSPIPGTMVGVGTQIIILTADDGNSTTDCTFNVVVSDGTPPMITCPADLIEDAGTNCMFAIPDYTALAIAADACGTVTVTQNPVVGSMVSLGDTTITLTASDGTLTTDCTFTLTVVDNTPIVLVCPPTQNETADVTNMFTLPDYTSLATATDNCGTPTLTQSPVAGTMVGLGTTVVTITATSGAEMMTCDFDVVVNSATAPDITCPADQVEDATANCEFIVPDYITAATVNNGSGSGTITQMPVAGTIVNAGLTTITLTLTDGAFTDSCNFSLTVNDVTPPMITCPADLIEDAGTNCMFTIPDYTALAIAADACGAVIVTQSPVVGSMVGLGDTTITLTASDGTLTTDCTFTLTVEDNTPIALTCPPTQNETADVTNMFTLPDYTSLATATDNCGTPTLTQSPVAGTMVGLGTTVVTITATSGAEMMTCDFDVVVNSATAPDITCPADQVEDATANCEFIIPDYTTAATVNNGSGSGTITQMPIAGTIVNEGITTITLTLTDGAFTDSCNFSLTVNDVTRPTITCPATQIEDADMGCMFTLPDYTALAIAADACGTVTVTQNPVVGSMVSLGDTTITLTASDGTLTTDCTFTLTVEDNTPIVLVCPPTQNETADVTNMFTLPDYTSLATATDNCGTPTLTQSPVAGTMVGLGTTVVTITATSGAEMMTCDFDVVVNSAAAPNIVCPANQVEDATVTCEFIVPDYTTAATVNNGSGSGTITQMPVAGTIVNAGITTITLTLTDGAFTDSCNFSLTVNDVTRPTITCPATQIEDAGTNCMFAIPDYTALATAADACGAVTVTQSPVVGSMVGLGDTTITLTASDGTLTTDCTFTLTVLDNTAPMAVCQNITVSLDAFGQANITANDIDNGSADACGNSTTSIDITTFDCSNLGENTVTLTVTDDAGLTSTCTAIVTVVDELNPMAMCQNISVALVDGIVTITPDQVDGGSTDNCGNVTLSIDVDTFDCTNVGENTVTLTVTDDNGNTSTCEAIVTITEEEAPIALCQNITIQLDTNGMAMITPDQVDGDSTDNCGNVTLDIDLDTFTCSEIGENEITLFVTDTSGNMSSCVATVTVVDTTAPIAICQDITIFLDEAGEASITVDDINNNSTDACGVTDVSIDITDFSCDNFGDNIVTLTVTDVNGNSSQCEAVVTVAQNNATPIAVCQNITATLNEEGIATITASNIDAGSTGAGCNSGLTIDINTFTCENLGQNNVTLTVTNGNGETDTCIAVVNVIDTLAPNIVCPEDIVIISAFAPYDLPNFIENGTVILEDNCVSNFTITQNPPQGTPVNEGETDIEIIVTNPSGSSILCEFTIFVDPSLNTENIASLGTITVLPNPADQFVVISNINRIPLHGATLYDIMGRVVKQFDLTNMTTERRLDLSNIASANYILIIQGENGDTSIERILKK